MQLCICLLALSAKCMSASILYWSTNSFETAAIISHVICHRKSLTLRKSINSSCFAWLLFFNLLFSFFANFFSIRFINIMDNLFSKITLYLFSHSSLPVTIDVSSLLSQSPNTNCELDPIPTSLFKQCSNVQPIYLFLLVTFLISSTAALFIPTSKMITWI